MSTLYTIATPIGNLEDITLRALRLLSEVDVIACEDTREAKKLLQSHSIPTPMLLSYHAQSAASRETEILQHLQDGKSVAVISDRGTPGISDPGSLLIQFAIAAGIPVVPIPGPSAVITALQGAGVDTSRFFFGGFVPHKKGRQTFLQQTIERPETVVFYESPHRILKCLEQLVSYGIADRPMVVARELTKQYEEFLRGTAEDVLSALQDRPKMQGEFVVILAGH